MKTFILQNQKPFMAHISKIHIRKPSEDSFDMVKFFMKH